MRIEYFLTAITVVTAAFVAYVAYQQYRISRERFKLDLFEKRFSVYKGMQAFLSNILQEGKVDMAKVYQFRAETQDSAFLFDEDIVDYLGRIDSKSLEAWALEEELRDLPVGKDRTTKSEENSRLLEWLIKQLPELKQQFFPYLKFRTWKA